MTLHSPPARHLRSADSPRNPCQGHKNVCGRCPVDAARSLALCNVAVALQRRLHLLAVAGHHGLVDLAVLQLAHNTDFEVADLDRDRLRVVRLLLRVESNSWSANIDDHSPSFSFPTMLMRNLSAATESGFEWCAFSYRSSQNNGQRCIGMSL